jgi:pilus assembly protein CpaC
MKRSKVALAMQILMLVFLSVMISASRTQAGEESIAAPDQDTQVMLSAAGPQELLRVFEGKSFVLNSSEPFKRISVTNDQVATAMVVTPNQVLIHGLKAGTVSLLLWNEQEQIQAFDLQVQAVPMNLDPLRATLSRALPGEDIRVSQSGSAIMLTGTVSSQAIIDSAASIAKTEAPAVVTLLTTTPMNQVVMLEVKFAEVQRNAAQELGMNIFSTGALNTPGVISTQQFGPPTAQSLTNSIGSKLPGFSTNFNFSDLLNIFAFRPDLNLGVMIRALQQKSMLETLAEPNLLALEGKEAAFLAGGEFPVPIIQGTGGNQSVGVQFKEFGVRLKFKADPNPDGTINLHIEPEVSSLDYANAVTLSGFLIPALISRKAETDIQLKDGQSFAIAGLLDNRVTKIDNKIPWLGDVPILGKLFRSQKFQKGNSELLVMVTPRIVKPLDPGQTSPLPAFPVPFLDPRQFDGKSGQVPVKTKADG